ncbi:MAG: right-handed parallel beta-helix repeat-containing protein [Thermodesulfobacteriota bacterium]
MNILHPHAVDAGAPCGISPATPWRTLHYAAARLTDGDRLFVAPGVYSVANGESDSALEIMEASNIEIYGASGGGTLLDGTGAVNWTNGIEINHAPGIVIAGLEIVRFSGNGIYLGHVSEATVRGCRIHDLEKGSGIRLYNCDSTTRVANNDIYDVYTGISVDGGVRPVNDNPDDEDDDTPNTPTGTLQVVLEDDGSSFVMGCFIDSMGE